MDPLMHRFRAAGNTMRSLTLSISPPSSLALLRRKALTRLRPSGQTGRLLTTVAAASGGLYIKTAGISGETLADFGNPGRRVTDSLLVLNAAMYALQVFNPSLIGWGAKINSSVAAGQWYRLITCTVLHGGLLHLFMNCQALASLGPFVESNSGKVRYLAVYAVSAIAGSLLSYRFSAAASVGASGAIFGLGGATALLLYRHRDRSPEFTSMMLRNLGQSLLINVVLGLSSPRIDNWGHAGGLIGGLIAAWLLGPNIKPGPDGRISDRPPLPLLAFKGRIR